jgi:hypothetical protein
MFCCPQTFGEPEAINNSCIDYMYEHMHSVVSTRSMSQKGIKSELCPISEPYSVDKIGYTAPYGSGMYMYYLTTY